MAFPLRVGSRASRLALVQAEEVAQRLRRAHGLGAADIVIVPLSTKGDRVRSRPLWEMGGKGLFTAQIEAQLLAGTLHAAVHSLKDMPTKPTAGLCADVLLPRQDARDVLISASSGVPDIANLPPGCRVGTCAPRRMAQLLWLRPDAEAIPLRGNVETRLQALHGNNLDAILLARAGLQRLDLAPESSATLPPEDMLPGAGQGVIAVQYRHGDGATAELLAPIHHRETGLCAAAEKSLLLALDGSCTTPAGAFAEIRNGRLTLRGRLLSLDGAERREVREQADADAAEAIGQRAGEALLRQKPQRRGAAPCS